MTIADLKVGAKLVFGSYGVGDATHPITWLKANREGGEFLSLSSLHIYYITICGKKQSFAQAFFAISFLRLLPAANHLGSLDALGQKTDDFFAPF